MSKIETFVSWLDEYRDVAFEVLRIYLGTGLFVRGVLFLYDPSAYLELLPEGETGSFLASESLFYATAFTHLIGGALMTVGFLTRVGALVQIPILAGAVVLVHLRGGLLTSTNQSFEFATLVLFLLVLVFVYGAGRWSLDERMGSRLNVFSRLEAWAATHHDLAFDLLRIYLGVGLFVRGAVFITDSSAVLELMGPSSAGWLASVATVHYVALAHLFGGAMMAFGLFTRLAALVQIPVLIGAVFLVHVRGGLLEQTQSFEFSVLVLFLLVLIFLYGSGKWSVDYYFFTRRMEARLAQRSEGAHEILSREITQPPIWETEGDVATAARPTTKTGVGVLTCPLLDDCPVVAMGANAKEHPWVEATTEEPASDWTIFFYGQVEATPEEILYTCQKCGQVVDRSSDPDDVAQSGDG